MIRILVVDDDPDIRDLIAYTLSDEGYQVDVASDGHEAIGLVSQSHPDVILLDMKMPVMDGWEFTRQYRRLHDHKAAIVVLTAARDAAQRAAEIGADDYVAKPFDLDGLVNKLALVTGKRR